MSEPKKHGAGTRDTQELCMQLAADQDDKAVYEAGGRQGRLGKSFCVRCVSHLPFDLRKSENRAAFVASLSDLRRSGVTFDRNMARRGWKREQNNGVKHHPCGARTLQARCVGLRGRRRWRTLLAAASSKQF